MLAFTFLVAVTAGCGTEAAEDLTRPSDQRYEATGTVLESTEHGPELCLGAVADSYPPQCGGLPLVGWAWDNVSDEESASGTKWVSARVQGTYDGERFTLTAPPGAPREPKPDEWDFEPACDDPEVVDPDRGLGDWEEAVEGRDIPGLAAVWVTDPGGPEWDGPFVANAVVRPGFGGQAKAFIRESWHGYLCVVERDQPSAEELDDILERLDGVLTQTILYGSANHRRGVVEATIIVVDEQARREVEDAFGPALVELKGALTPV